MGVVYSGFDDELDRRVAIKVLRKVSPKATERMRREAQAMAKIAHPNVAGVYEVGSFEGQTYMAIEFVKGQTLREWLESGERSTAEILEVMSQAGRGAGLVHRDFKPDNVMVGEDARVRVLDFGLAGSDGGAAPDAETLETAVERMAKTNPFSTPLTETGTLMGTPAYMSPEQFSGGEMGPASDQFSFCVALYEALYGERPFQGETVPSLVLKVARGEVRDAPPGRKVAPALRAVIIRGLAVDAGARHEDMAALLAALDEIAGRGRRRRWQVAGGLSAALAVAVAVWSFQVWGQKRASDQRADEQSLIAKEQTVVAEEATSAARRTAIAKSNALLIAQAWRFRDSPTEAAAMLREVQGTEPHEVFGFNERAAPLVNEHRNFRAHLQGHSNSITSVAFSPEGDRIVTGSSDKTARVWSANGSGAPVILKGHESSIVSASFSPDGSRVLTASHDKTARVWSADDSGSVITLAGHGHTVWSAVFSPDGSRVATASGDKTARVWHSDGSGTPVILQGHSDTVRSAAFSPDGSRIVTSSLDGTARIWRTDGSGSAAILRGHDAAVVSASFSPGGSRIVTASSDGTARVWHADGSGAPIVLDGQAGEVHTATFSADGSHILTASFDLRSTARVWKADGSGAPVILRGHSDVVRSASFSPDGARVLTASFDKTARVWNADGSGAPIIFAGHSGRVWSAAFNNDGSRIVTASYEKSARVWNVGDSGTPFAKLEDETLTAGGVYLSPDGSRGLTGSEDKKVRVWNTDGLGPPAVLTTLTGHAGRLTSACFSPDGSRILTASDDGTARVWSTNGAGTPIILAGHDASIGSAAFDRAGSRIVTASDDETARVWNADGSGSPVVLVGHEGAVKSATFSPDGSSVVTGSADNTARVWKADGSHSPVVLRGHSDTVRSVIFSPDGSHVATASVDHTVRVWRADGSGLPVVLQANNSFEAMAFSPDGLRVLVVSRAFEPDGGTTKIARLWNADGSGSPIVIAPKNHLGYVASVSFSPDGSRIAATSVEGFWSGPVNVWRQDWALLGPRSFFWQTPFCHSAATRRRLLAESEASAAARHERCLELTDFCLTHSDEECHLRVTEIFGGEYGAR
jgi:WD40 repeat protein